MKYKVLKEDQHMFHVKHPNGKEFKVAKHGLSPSTIQKIQSFAEGGSVEEDPQTEEVQAPSITPDYLNQASQAPNDSLMSGIPITDKPFSPQEAFDVEVDKKYHSLLNSNYAHQNAEDLKQQAKDSVISDLTKMQAQHSQEQKNQDFLSGLKAPQLSSDQAQNQLQAPDVTPQASTPQPNQAPDQQVNQPQAQPGMNPMEQYYKDAMQAQLGLGNQGAKLSEQQAAVLAKQQDDLNTYMKTSQANLADVQMKHQKLADEIASGKYDSKPGQYWKQMSTGSKIGTVISLMLGSLGAAGNGGRNMAADVLNKNIDREMEMQQRNLGNKRTMLSDLLQQEGSLERAQDRFRMLNLAAAQGEIQRQTALSNSVTMKLQGKLAYDQLGMQRSQLEQQYATEKAKAQMMGQGGAGGGMTEADIPYAIKNDPKLSERLVKVGDKLYVHRGDAKSAANLNDVEAKVNPILSGVKQIEQLGPQAAVPGTPENQQAISIGANLKENIAAIKAGQIGSKRLNEASLHLAADQFGDPTKITQLIAHGVKNQQFIRNLSDDMEALRSQNLYGYKGMNSIPGRKTGGW